MKMTKQQVLDLLDDIKKRVETGDSFEGSFSYSGMEEECGPGEFSVRATYRVGNRDGQGGMRIVE